MAKTGIEPDVWLSNNAAWKLVMPVEDTERLLALKADQEWSSARDAVSRVVESSALGRRLFGPAAKACLIEEVDKKIGDAVKEFAKGAVLDELHLTAVLGKYVEEMKQLPAFDELPAKRQVMVNYGEWQFEWSVCSVTEHLEVALRSYVRRVACTLGLLDALPSEEVLCAPLEQGDSATKIADSLLKRARSCRAFLKQLRDAEESSDGFQDPGLAGIAVRAKWRGAF